jgi:phosphoserine aminotransferase
MEAAAWSFAAGPARLPDAVLARAADALFARGKDGTAAIERPFTGEAFRAVLARARARLAELLALPDGYHVLFMAGGAMHQFALVPLNLCGAGQSAAYADSGYWSRRAIAEARRFAKVEVVARHAGERALAAPHAHGWFLSRGSAYCHITPNETADGLAWPELPDTGEVPLVADATSCFLAAPLDVSRFGLIYASAQKNIGLAGLTVVIVREDLLARTAGAVPSAHAYAEQARADNCVNTPPTAAVHVAALVFDWIAEQGGLAAMAEANRRKAQCLYDTIEASGGFYVAPVAAAHRSTTNVRFHLHDERLTARFLAEAGACGLHHLAGHPQVGGVRASLYNAMPQAGARALADFMNDFLRRAG